MVGFLFADCGGRVEWVAIYHNWRLPKGVGPTSIFHKGKLPSKRKPVVGRYFHLPGMGKAFKWRTLYELHARNLPSFGEVLLVHRATTHRPHRGSQPMSAAMHQVSKITTTFENITIAFKENSKKNHATNPIQLKMRD